MATRIAAPEVSSTLQGAVARVPAVDDDAASRALCSLALQLAGLDVPELKYDFERFRRLRADLEHEQPAADVPAAKWSSRRKE